MSDTTRNARSLSVLVAEDDRVSQRLVVTMLQRLGHRAEVASNGAEAVSAATRARFDLALMDLGMPVLDGLAAMAAIRSHEATSSAPRLPIVALTAADDEAARARCLDAGADRWVAKPLVPRELAALLDWAREPDNAARGGAPDDAPAAVDAAMIAGYAQDAAFLVMLIGEFFAEVPRRLDALRTGCAAGDLAALKFQAHALKGGARVFGAARLAELCFAVEHITAVADAVPALAALEAEAHRVEIALDAVRRDIST